jgi:hypothetical protein
MNALRLITTTSLAAIALAVQGCYSVVSEKHTFVASNRGTNNLSLVQVNIEGYADMADMKFRAGYRDSGAIDEVLKGDTTPITTQSYQSNDTKLSEQAEVITADLLKKLAAAYERSAPPEEIRRLEENITRARGLPRIVRAAGTSLIAEAPAEKFIVTFSADPSKVFKAIADTTARNETEGAIFKSLRDFATDEQNRRAAAMGTTKAAWESLLGSVKTRLPAVADEDKAQSAADSLRSVLLQYQNLLNDFVALKP